MVLGPLRNPPLTQLLLLSLQILPQSRWFQMSSSWPDSLTTWPSSRTEKPPRPPPPRVFLCRLKFGQTPFPLPAKTPPLPYKNKAETHPSTCLCSARAPPRAAGLNSLGSFPRLLLFTDLICVLLFLQPS